jgi:cytochrome P450
MSVMADGSPAFRPWTPRRRTRPLGLIPFLWVSWRDPLGMWSERHFREPQLYGRSQLGEILVVSHPEGVRHVLAHNAANYEKGELQRRVLGPMLADGLLLTEGEAWRRVRRILAPLFTPARVASMTDRMVDRSRRRVEGWRLDLGPRVLNLDAEMSGLTFDMLSATLFSDQLDGDAEGFERALNSYLGLAARIDPLDVLAAPDWIPRLRGVTGAGPGRFFESRVSALVARRRAQIEAGEPVADDLLTALLNARDEEGGEGLSDHEVASNVLTFILAGHETTARTLGWALHLISRTPDVAARLRGEADAFDPDASDWAERLPWTRAVIEEAMRLFPPAPTLARRALGPDVIGGQAIGAGATVLISPWVLHRHELLWEAPNEFRPERFLPENRKSVDRWTWIPFSAGPRVCIGATFALNEAMIALATILRNAEVQPIAPAEPRPVHQITLRSAQPIRLKLRARA